jgi:hypothetical protein
MTPRLSTHVIEIVAFVERLGLGILASGRIVAGFYFAPTGHFSDSLFISIFLRPTTDMEGNTTRQHPRMTEAHKKCNRDAKSFLQKSNHYLNDQYVRPRS